VNRREKKEKKYSQTDMKHIAFFTKRLRLDNVKLMKVWLTPQRLACYW